MEETKKKHVKKPISKVRRGLQSLIHDELDKICSPKSNLNCQIV